MKYKLKNGRVYFSGKRPLDGLPTQKYLCRCSLCINALTIDVAGDRTVTGQYLIRSEFEEHQRRERQYTSSSVRTLKSEELHFSPLPSAAPPPPPLFYDASFSGRTVSEDLEYITKLRERYKDVKGEFKVPQALSFEIAPNFDIITSEDDTFLSLRSDQPDNEAPLKFEAFIRLAQELLGQCRPDRDVFLRLPAAVFRNEMQADLDMLREVKKVEWDRQCHTLRDAKELTVIDTGDHILYVLFLNSHCPNSTVQVHPIP